MQGHALSFAGGRERLRESPGACPTWIRVYGIRPALPCARRQRQGIIDGARRRPSRLILPLPKCRSSARASRQILLPSSAIFRPSSGFCLGWLCHLPRCPVVSRRSAASGTARTECACPLIRPSRFRDMQESVQPRMVKLHSAYYEAGSSGSLANSGAGRHRQSC